MKPSINQSSATLGASGIRALLQSQHTASGALRREWLYLKRNMRGFYAGLFYSDRMPKLSAPSKLLLENGVLR